MVANTICYLIEFNKEEHLEVLEEIMLEDSEKLFNYLMHFLERKITALHNIIDEVLQRHTLINLATQPSSVTSHQSRAEQSFDAGVDDDEPQSGRPSLVPHLSYLLSGLACGVDERGVGNAAGRPQQRSPHGLRAVPMEPPFVLVGLLLGRAVVRHVPRAVGRQRLPSGQYQPL